jgi:dCMP deaminase
LSDTRPIRPSIDEYMMSIAVGVRARANCKGSHIGAVLAREGHIVSTGYNGTPHGTTNCDEGGCDRCSNRERYPSGTGYDLCICVHAEQNALLSAARFGISVDGSLLYTTWRPCFGCTKEMLQAGVLGVRYGVDWEPNEDLRSEYERLQSYFPDGVKQIALLNE